MRIYIAASLSAKTQAQGLRDDLENNGFEVKASWLDMETGYDRSDADLQKAAQIDRDDLEAASVVIHAFPSIRSSGGGADTELGMALALNKRVIVYGPKKNIFHWSKGVRHTTCRDVLMNMLRTM